MTWKYLDNNNSIVGRNNEDGSFSSTLVSSCEVREWVASGNTIEPYSPPAITIEEISVAMWQARAALDIKGLLDDADAAVAASSNPAIRQYWEYATTLDEGNDFTKAFAAIIGLTEAEMHDLFVAASAINL